MISLCWWRHTLRPHFLCNKTYFGRGDMMMCFSSWTFPSDVFLACCTLCHLSLSSYRCVYLMVSVKFCFPKSHNLRVGGKAITEMWKTEYCFNNDEHTQSCALLLLRKVLKIDILQMNLRAERILAPFSPSLTGSITALRRLVWHKVSRDIVSKAFGTSDKQFGWCLLVAKRVQKETNS